MGWIEILQQPCMGREREVQDVVSIKANPSDGL